MGFHIYKCGFLSSEGNDFMINMKSSRSLFPIILIIFIVIVSVLYLISCTSGVDIGESTVYVLTIQNDGDCSTFPSGQIEVTHGKPVDITAIPDSIYGYNNQFTGWTVITGTVSFGNSNASSTTVTLSNGDAAIQANFDQDQIGLSSLSIVPDNKKLTISWNPILDTQTYTLYYTTDTLVPEISGTGVSIANAVSPYDLNVPVNDVLYTVQVRASSSSGEHVWTDFERAIPLTKTALIPNTFGTYREVYLDWPALTSTSNYQVLRATSAGGPYVPISGMIGENKYTDSSVSLYQKYYYKVRPAYTDTLASHESYARYAEPSPFGIVQHGRIGGSFSYESAVAIQGSYAYVTYDTGSTWGLRVLDVSNPDQPSQVGTSTTTAAAMIIEISNDYAYIASDQTFMVVNISTPSSPLEVGSCTISDTIMDIAISGNYAFVITYTGGLKVVDISTKSAPDLIETAVCNTGAWGSGVAIKGTYAYVADTGVIDSSGLKVVNISNPETLSDSSLVASCLFFGGGLKVEIADDSSGNTYAYVVDNVYPGSVFVIDINDPPNVSDSSNIGGCNTGGGLIDLVLSGNHALLIGDECIVVDIHDPTNVSDVSLVGRYDLYCYAVAAEGDYVYINAWYSGNYYLYVLYCLVPSNPSVLRTHDTVSFTRKVAIDGDYAYVADGSGLKVFSISNPSSSSEVASCSIAGGISSVAVHGPYAFVGGQSSGFSVIDISDPEAVNNNSVINVDPHPSLISAWDIKVRGDLAFVADNQDGLIVIDISDPENPSVENTPFYGTDFLDIALYGDYAYTAVGFDGGIDILNIDRNSPDFLNKVGEFPDPTDPTIWTNGVAVRGNYVYAAVGEFGSEELKNIYVSSDFSTILEEGVLSATGPQGVDVHGDYVFIADSTAGMKIIQVSDPTSPLVAGSVSTLSAWDVVVNGTYAYLVDGDWTAGNNKFRIIDLMPDN
jgi:hypothetical protein